MKVFVSTGSAAGELYASLVIPHLRQIYPGTDVVALGNGRMAQAGARVIGEIRDIRVNVLWDSVRLPSQAFELQRIANLVRQERPDVFLPVGFSDFNARLLGVSRAVGARNIFLAPPRLWNWGKRRTDELTSGVDRVICLFPFEQARFRQLGCDAHFLGNPLAEHVQSSASRAEVAAQLGIKNGARIIALMPGTRPGEVRRNLPVLARTFTRLCEAKPGDYVGAMLVPEQIPREVLPAYLRITYVRDNHYPVLKHAALVLAGSGTAALEAALLGAPLIAVHRLSRLSWRLVRRLARLSYSSVPNLILGRRVFPEFLQPETDAIVATANQLLDGRDQCRLLAEAGAEIRSRLARPDSAREIARAVFA